MNLTGGEACNFYWRLRGDIGKKSLMFRFSMILQFPDGRGLPIPIRGLSRLR